MTDSENVHSMHEIKFAHSRQARRAWAYVAFRRPVRLGERQADRPKEREREQSRIHKKERPIPER